MSDWAIKRDYGFEAVKVIRTTEKMVVYKGRYGEARCFKVSVLNWRGTQEEAARRVEQLTSAKAERDRRHREASLWLERRIEEIVKGEK